MSAASLSPALEKNLRALATQDQALVDRLLQPAAIDHVILSPDGPPLYRHHGQLLPMNVGTTALEEALQACPEDAPEALIFGLGQGELLAHLLRRRPNTRLIAWERDPWLVRETLSRWDYSRSIEAGRLQLALGVDLALDLEHLASLPRVVHPTLRQVYGSEWELLDQPQSDGPWAAVGLGGLFVDDLSAGLREEGYRVFPVELARWSREEIEGALERLDPALVATVNPTAGLPELCEAQSRRLLIWEIDPTPDRTAALAGATHGTYVFTYREANVPALRAAGYSRVEHLPLAANPDKRQPVELDEGERAHYHAPVCFVGASLANRSDEYRRKFLHLYATWACSPEAQLVEVEAHLQDLLDTQREDYSTYRICELAEQRFGPLLEAARLSGTRQDPASWLAEIAAADKRLDYVSALIPQGVRVWGDRGWREVELKGARYMGQAEHDEELSRIYSGGAVHIDINRLYQADVVPLRVFDVLACGGFLLAEHSDELEELFQVGQELETYRTRDELVEKVAHFIAHPDEAVAIAARGRAAVLARHTVRQRVQRMLAASAN